MHFEWTVFLTRAGPWMRLELSPGLGPGGRCPDPIPLVVGRSFLFSSPPRLPEIDELQVSIIDSLPARVFTKEVVGNLLRHGDLFKFCWRLLDFFFPSSPPKF